MGQPEGSPQRCTGMLQTYRGAPYSYRVDSEGLRLSAGSCPRSFHSDAMALPPPAGSSHVMAALTGGNSYRSPEIRGATGQQRGARRERTGSLRIRLASLWRIPLAHRLAAGLCRGGGQLSRDGHAVSRASRPRPTTTCRANSCREPPSSETAHAWAGADNKTRATQTVVC